jgi:hypothetical protein
LNTHQINYLYRDFAQHFGLQVLGVVAGLEVLNKLGWGETVLAQELNNLVGVDGVGCLELLQKANNGVDNLLLQISFTTELGKETVADHEIQKLWSANDQLLNHQMRKN